MDGELVITREEFVGLITPILNKIEKIVRKAIADAKFNKKRFMKPEDINEVLVVGGSSRIPAVQDVLKKIFSEQALNYSQNPDHAIAMGAVVQAASLANQFDQVSIIEAVPLSIGDVVCGSIFDKIIWRNTPIPTKVFDRWYYTTENDQKKMDFEVGFFRDLCRHIDLLTLSLPLPLS